MGGLVYFSSGSGNTARFVARLGLPATRLPRRGDDPLPAIATPFVLICPTYADGQGRGAVPRQVIRFLNDPAARALLRGVIASGNRNFGATFAMAGRVIADKCGVPLLYRFELAGTDTDITRIRTGLARFWTEQEDTPCLMQA
ncbi:class Ib ribonucleoside-diphosphate reductase assembly flavoprotein NrdI [Aquicoccus porphyridii]|uniref:Protein NrdI n=1 Tax=Aquicoccus porphyridii TaxID=1852029 RepID=A0A5A9ZIB2_9RHOB|nr:class Ib ribonucleoside-diphosphate reductase assembly flavoprotein NrdI [Aquicoccus porphyridii]KAA0916765.1 class Ib ribonucleoside-diphosphate reductase assembly flavoprotein NrdI [Aquicoccus porphyridii]RAI54017.1 class Ib ribonucleoside-diphosphate reductase assembly flavoprotein NrdI [Rhodobacteraceae bacterium AsT-22]